MRQLKEEAVALVATFAAVCIGSLVFVTITMPFVFPFVVAAAIALAWRHARHPNSAPRSPAGPRSVKPLSRRPHLIPV